MAGEFVFGAQAHVWMRCREMRWDNSGVIPRGVNPLGIFLLFPDSTVIYSVALAAQMTSVLSLWNGNESLFLCSQVGPNRNKFLMISLFVLYFISSLFIRSK